MNHVILGFTCNKKRYIYNSLNSNKNLKNPCGFYKFNWDINDVIIEDKAIYLDEKR